MAFARGREIAAGQAGAHHRPGRSCDLGLFGDMMIEKLHARIYQQDGRRLIADAGLRERHASSTTSVHPGADAVALRRFDPCWQCVFAAPSERKSRVQPTWSEYVSGAVTSSVSRG